VSVCIQTPSSQKEALEVQAVLAKPQWRDQIEIYWCPGYMGIRGNEEADAAAKQASTAEDAGTHKPTIA